MGVVCAAAQGLDIHTMRAMLLTSLVLACLLAGASGKRRVGHGRGKGKGKDRKLMGPKSWHVAGPEGKASCGNYTLLYTEELPSSLCETANSTICQCVTRGDLSGQEEVEWKYICGTCQLKWRPTRDEEAIKEMKKKREERKQARLNKSKKQMDRKKDMRMKMRQKMKIREGKREKKLLKKMGSQKTVSDKE